MPSADEAKRRHIAWYDHIAAAYDRHGLPMSLRVAELVVRHAEIREGQRILDVGTGTGNVALAVARSAGSRDLVAGVDLSAGMLLQARRRAAGLRVAFWQMDAEALAFGDAVFDVVVSSLLAGVSPVRALREMHRVLRAGGRAVFGSYADQTHEPLAALTWSQLECHGIVRRAPASDAGAAPPETERFRSWFEEAGFAESRVVLETYAFELNNAQDWWIYVRRSTRWGPMLERLDPADLDRLRADILREVDALRGGGGLEVDGSSIIGIGVRR